MPSESPRRQRGKHRKRLPGYHKGEKTAQSWIDATKDWPVTVKRVDYTKSEPKPTKGRTKPSHGDTAP